MRKEKKVAHIKLHGSGSFVLVERKEWGSIFQKKGGERKYLLFGGKKSVCDRLLDLQKGVTHFWTLEIEEARCPFPGGKKRTRELPKEKFFPRGRGGGESHEELSVILTTQSKNRNHSERRELGNRWKGSQSLVRTGARDRWMLSRKKW